MLSQHLGIWDLVVEAGNSTLKVALFAPNLEPLFYRFTHPAELSMLYAWPIKRAFLAATGDSEIYDALKLVLQSQTNPFATDDAKVITLNPEGPLPFKNLYGKPELLGADRIAHAAASVTHFPNQNVLTLDFGTCLTVDFTDASGQFLGGAISLGYSSRLKAMAQFTAKLPELAPETPWPDKLMNNNTQDCMLAGAGLGMLNEVIAQIEFYRAQFNDLKVVITGGDASYFEKRLSQTTFVDPLWNLKGFHAILNLQD